jgi:hypothetical protein
MLSRIDAPVYLIPLPVLAALAWLSAKSVGDRRWLARMFGVFLLGAFPVAILGAVDVVKLAGTYYHDLRHQVHQIQAGLAVSFIIGVILVIVWPYARSRFGSQGRWFREKQNAIAIGAGVAFLSIFLAAWAIRPALMHPRTAPNEFITAFQRAAGLPADPGRTYAENTVIWLSWYLGPITIALGAIGAAIAVTRLIRRPNPAYLLVLSVAGIGTALYIWNPSIVPDQIWAMRRFVPAALPLLVLLAALAIAAISDLVSRQAGSMASTAVGAMGGAAMLVFPIATTIPVGGFQPEAGASAAIAAACRAIGPKAAIVTAPGDTPAEETISALRDWCNIPVAMLTQPLSADQMKRLADEWKAEGSTLWVVGSTPASVKAAAPGLTPSLLASDTFRKELEMTINRPPSRYSGSDLFLYGSPVAP